MQASLLHNGMNIQRRKMYPIHRRHNQKSNIQLNWMYSIENPSLDFNQRQKQKKEKQMHSIRDNYNRYVQKQLDHQFWAKNQPPKTIPTQQNESIMITPKTKSKTIDVQTSLDEQVLNKQLQNFNKNNQSTLGSSRHKSIDSPSKINFDPISQKQYNLKSAFDKSLSYQNPNQQIQQIYINTKPKAYKHFDYDKLEKHLRYNLKKTSRY